MKVDPIVEEIRQGRMEHAKKFNFDLAKIAEDYRKIEERYKERIISGKLKRSPELTES